jgi:hypothetical protein
LKTQSQMNKKWKQLEGQHRRVLTLCKEAGLVTTGIEGVRNFYQKNESLKHLSGYQELREMLNDSFAYFRATRK